MTLFPLLVFMDKPVNFLIILGIIIRQKEETMHLRVQTHNHHMTAAAR